MLTVPLIRVSSLLINILKENNCNNWNSGQITIVSNMLIDQSKNRK